jgi:hypothetical protein
VLLVRLNLGLGMKILLCILAMELFTAASLRAGTPGYAYCGTYGSYVLLYKSVDQLEELGHLRCGEKVEVLTRWVEYIQVRTLDGRVGWVHYSGISTTAGAAPSTNFGMTDAAAGQAQSVPALTNTNIMKMHVMRLGADVIVAKIKSSPCEFDTSPAALQKLKQAALPDKVILAMVQAPSASAPLEPKRPEVVAVNIPRGTPIEVELSTSVSSDTAQDGMIVPMTVSQDVVVNGATMFQKGSEARARVTTIKQPGFMNRPPGAFSWTMEYVTAVTGEHVAVTFYSKEAAANPTSSFMGAPGPSWEFRKGKPAVVPAGQRFDTVVHDAAVLKLPPAMAPAQASQNATPAMQTWPQPAGQPSGKP